MFTPYEFTPKYRWAVAAVGARARARAGAGARYETRVDPYGVGPDFVGMTLLYVESKMLSA
jgi:hypothetical protein